MSAVDGRVAISYGKGAFCVWVGSSVNNNDGRSTELLESAPNFNETVVWVAGDCARVNANAFTCRSQLFAPMQPSVVVLR